MCQRCGEEEATQIHHLRHQADADKDTGFIDGFHKNHPGNLLGVCDACHEAFHDSDTQHRMARTAGGYQLVEADVASR